MGTSLTRLDGDRRTDWHEETAHRNAQGAQGHLGQTSLFRFPVGTLDPLRTEFLAAPQKTAATYVFEQRFVTRRAPGTKAVIFPGGLNPPDAIAGRWNADMPVMGRREHMRAGLRGERDGGLFRHIRHFILPARWVDDAWRE